MTIAEIKQISKDIGITLPKGKKKAALICAIQTAEGNFPCFGTAREFCDQHMCSWRTDCLRGKKCPRA